MRIWLKQQKIKIEYAEIFAFVYLQEIHIFNIFKVLVNLIDHTGHASFADYDGQSLYTYLKYYIPFLVKFLLLQCSDNLFAKSSLKNITQFDR